MMGTLVDKGSSKTEEGKQTARAAVLVTYFLLHLSVCFTNTFQLTKYFVNSAVKGNLQKQD